MTYIPKETDRIVRRRAGNRCEYCLSPQAYASSKLEIEHIIPGSEGGSTEGSNLALACRSCNLAKLAKTSGSDEITREECGFFNPRIHSWPEHFQWSEDCLEIIGITAIGRVTVTELKLNNDLMKEARENWREGQWRPLHANTV